MTKFISLNIYDICRCPYEERYFYWEECKMANLLGGWKVAGFNGVKCNFEQGAASAWAAFDGSGFVGASYRPLLFCASQVVNGVNWGFIAEQTMIFAEPERHVVKLVINEYVTKNEETGEPEKAYKLVPQSIEQIF